MNSERWVYNNNTPDCALSKELADFTGISPVTAAVALNRGIKSAGELSSFINKLISGLHCPFLMKDMDNCVDTLKQAIKSNKKITVYGDYDVDGITSVAILVKYLQLQGVAVDYYIPDRMDEGYGLNKSALDSIKSSGTDLVITVDTGITACEEVVYAKEIGLDIIVTDHHQCKDILPDCIVLNPCRYDCGYPFKNLAGVGVVFKLISAMEGGDHLSVLNMFGDIIALGTVADVVSLTDENRIIVDHGIKKLMDNPNLGLSMLISVSGLDSKIINVGKIGFGIAPRINAAGRIGDTSKAVELLLSNSVSECHNIAEYLNEENRCRQETELNILNDVLKIINSTPEYKDKRVLVISGFGWHHGVIGIVASKITDKFSKPCILISCENGVGKGSGRSVKGFNLFEAMKSCSDVFEKFGGHELAAGLTISQNRIAEADQLLNKFAFENMPPECLIPRVDIDFELREEFISIETAENLTLLEPFGTDNPQPCFSICGATILDKRLMGNNKHTRFTMCKQNVRFEVISFNSSDIFYKFTENDLVDIAGVLSVNEWNNTKKIQIILKSIKLNFVPIPASLVPTREDLSALYIYIKKNLINNTFTDFISVLARKLTYTTKYIFDELKLINCLEIFSELNLLKFSVEDEKIDINLLKTDGSKVDLNSSKKLQNLQKSYNS